MDPNFEVYKNKIGERLTRTIADALAQGVLTEENVSEIANYILQHIDAAQNSAQLLDFLTNLAERWVIFDGILTLELGEVQQKHDSHVVQQAEQLIKENRIDEALQAVENADENMKGGTQNG